MNIDIIMDKNSKANLYIQIYKHIKKMILDGEILSNTKLPPIRKIANELNVNPATVVKAYNLLEREGLIYKKIGSGSFIAPVQNTFYLEEEKLMKQKELDMLEYGQIQLNDEIINFASATPSAALFPVEDFKKVLNKVLDKDKGEAFTYQKSQGYFPLRKSIRTELKEQEINADIDSIQIVSGAQQAIDLISKILVDYRDKVIVEKPTYSGALSAFQSRGAILKGIPILNDGLDLELLERYLKNNRVKILYTMPNFQNPTGVSWSIDKRKSLLLLANKYDFMIIEDDCLSELFYKGGKPLNLKALDMDERVIYIKSYSKIFMPGLRLAYMILPDRLIPSVLAAKYATDISTSGLTQRAFDLYLREGYWNRHLNKMRKLFGARYNLMYSAIKSLLPEDINLFHNPEGGLYFWLSLPQRIDSQKLYLKALNNHLAFLPGNVFMVEESPSTFLRLSFAAVDKEKIIEGMKIFAELCNGIHFSNNNEHKDGFTPLL